MASVDSTTWKRGYLNSNNKLNTSSNTGRQIVNETGGTNPKWDNPGVVPIYYANNPEYRYIYQDTGPNYYDMWKSAFDARKRALDQGFAQQLADIKDRYRTESDKANLGYKLTERSLQRRYGYKSEEPTAQKGNMILGSGITNMYRNRGNWNNAIARLGLAKQQDTSAANVAYQNNLAALRENYANVLGNA